jgi:hypothetical protein
MEGMGEAMSDERPDARPERERRPLLERIGMAALAAVLTVLFGVVAAAAWWGGEVFLAAMAAIGALMTVWAALSALIRD